MRNILEIVVREINEHADAGPDHTPARTPKKPTNPQPTNPAAPAPPNDRRLT
jgi:hypothetical protein